MLRSVAGWALVVAGAIVTPLPIPVGLAMIAVGLYLLAQESHAVRLAVRWSRRKAPCLDRGLRKARPKVPAGIQRFIDTTAPEATSRRANPSPLGGEGES